MSNKRSPLLPEHRFSGLLQLTSRLTGVCSHLVCLLLCVFESLQLPSSDPPTIPLTEDTSEWADPDGTSRNRWCLISSVITKWGRTRTRRTARIWSMCPSAGLKRSHISETCHFSLMSNLPHQKTFISINKAFTRESCPRSVCCLFPMGESVCLQALLTVIIVSIVDVCMSILESCNIWG